MTLENKLGITDPLELARAEEKLSKTRAHKLFRELSPGFTAEPGKEDFLKRFTPGSFQGLAEIHQYLFEEIYEFAGKLRTENISKGNFRFVPVMYLEAALKTIEALPQSTLEEIIHKYVEMNVAHPFREGNGRSMRIWLDLILKKELGRVVDWSGVDKNDYLLAMERSPVKETEILFLLKKALTDQVEDQAVYMKGIDASYSYEGYSVYRTEDLGQDRNKETP